MNDKLYRLMNWREIEAITYAECSKPHQLLSVHKVGKDPLVQAYFPDAQTVEAVYHTDADSSKNKVLLEQVDELGYYAAVMKGKNPKVDYYSVTYATGVEQFTDAYAHLYEFPKEFIKAFDEGECKDAYLYLGAHTMEIDHVSGVNFAVYAPNAIRVSVVGDFNHNNGGMHQMSKITKNGIFSIFIPDFPKTASYCYEIKCNGREPFRKADPYATRIGEDLSMAMPDLPQVELWNDEKYLQERKKIISYKEAINILTLPMEELMSGMKKGKKYEDYFTGIAKYAEEYDFTHISILKINNTTSFYALKEDVITKEQLKLFVNICHEYGIGVLMDLSASYFEDTSYGLMTFDGSCLYEHCDGRRSYHPKKNAVYFDYESPQTVSFLMSNVFYWLKEFHMDGFYVTEMEGMLYLDFQKKNGNWLSNKEGGNENLAAVSFISNLNDLVDAFYPGVIKIAQLNGLWDKLTTKSKNGGLNFDFVCDNGLTTNTTQYMEYDPKLRREHHEDVTFGMIYGYNEKFLTALNHKKIIDKSYVQGLPVKEELKLQNLRMLYAYLFMHPGKKDLFRVENIQWNEDKKLCMDYVGMDGDTIRHMNEFYITHPSLFTHDNQPDGFEWIDMLSANESVVAFLRKCELSDETILVVANFSANDYAKYSLGVPYAGKYKEEFNSVSSDKTSICNKKAIFSDDEGMHKKDHSIQVKLPAFSVLAFTYMPFDEKDLEIIRKNQLTNQARIEAQKRFEKEEKELLKEFEIQKEAVMKQAIMEANRKMAQMDKEYKQKEKERLLAHKKAVKEIKF